jgi:phage gp29-like protein
MSSVNVFQEYGNLGQYRYGGWFYEEFLRELRGRKGVEVYKEMSDNDDIIGALLFAIEMLMQQVEWNVKEAGNSEADVRAAEFVYSCMTDMDETWTDFISEVLSFLTFGWSFHEIVYKRRMGATKRLETKSKYDDGLIGWRKLPVRSQDTLWRWEYDDKDNLLGMIQCAPPLFGQVFIPIEKALHFKSKSRKNNPEGRSLLRNAYRSWYFKRRIQEVEGIGIERDLAGLPKITPPEGVDLYDENGAATEQLRMAEKIVQSVRRDEREGVVLPFGWEFELTSTGGRRQFDTNAIIERYDNRMAMTVLADFVMLGHEKVGSFALSSDKTELFGVALGTFLNIICEVFNNQAIPRLIDLNGDVFKGITGYPELIHGDIETQDLSKLGSFVKDMVSIGAITPDENMEDYLRMQADLPEREFETSYMGGKKKKPKTIPTPAVGDGDDGNPQEPDDEGDNP